MSTTINTMLFAGLVVLVSCLATSRASPMEIPEPAAQYEELEVFGRSSPDGDLVRLKRASCDLFSFASKWVTPNHAVCAAHCIGLGRRGGECKGTVCHCRH